MKYKQKKISETLTVITDSTDSPDLIKSITEAAALSNCIFEQFGNIITIRAKNINDAETFCYKLSTIDWYKDCGWALPNKYKTSLSCS